MLIYLRDAADLNLCLPLPSFLLTKAGIRIIRERQTIPLQTSAIKNAALAQSHVHRLPSKRAPRERQRSSQDSIVPSASQEREIYNAGGVGFEMSWWVP